MTEQKHTPLPYFIKDNGHYLELHAKSFGEIANMCPTLVRSGKKQELSNAEFIVRACNSHYHNEENIKVLVQALEKNAHYVETLGWQYNDDGLKNSGREMKAALAKAKGEAA